MKSGGILEGKKLVAGLLVVLLIFLLTASVALSTQSSNSQYVKNHYATVKKSSNPHYQIVSTIPLSASQDGYTSSSDSPKQAGRGAIDTTPPDVTYIYAPDNPVVGQIVTFASTATDPSGVKNMSLYVGGNYMQNCEGDSSTTTLSCSKGIIFANSGQVGYYVQAVDMAGNYVVTDVKVVTIS